MSERRCPACDRVLVQGPSEKSWQFRTRKTCGRKCFAVLAQKINRSRVDMKGEIESVEVAKRTAEVRRASEAKLEDIGCTFTGDLK